MVEWFLLRWIERRKVRGLRRRRPIEVNQQSIKGPRYFWLAPTTVFRCRRREWDEWVLDICSALHCRSAWLRFVSDEKNKVCFVAIASTCPVIWPLCQEKISLTNQQITAVMSALTTWHRSWQNFWKQILPVDRLSTTVPPMFLSSFSVDKWTKNHPEWVFRTCVCEMTMELWSWSLYKRSTSVFHASRIDASCLCAPHYAAPTPLVL